MQQLKNNLHLIQVDDKWIGLDATNFAIFEIEPEGAAFLQGDTSIDPKVQEELGYLLSQGYFQDLYLPKSMETFLLSYNFSIQNTLLCPLNCSYCFAKKIKSEPKSMSIEFTRQMLDFLFDQFKGQADLYEFVFTSGGEPLANFPVMQEVYNYGRQLGKEYGKEVRVGFTTNAILLDEEKIAFLDQTNMGMVISVDGTEEDHNRNRRDYQGSSSYDAVLKALERTKQSPSSSINRPYAMVVLTPYRSDYVGTLKHLVDIGFRRVMIKMVRNVEPDNLLVKMEDFPGIKEEYRKLFDFFYSEIVQNRWKYVIPLLDPNDMLGQIFINLLLRKKSMYRCDAGKTKFSILPNGDIYPCDYFSMLPETCMGNVSSGISAEARQKWFEQTCLQSCSHCWARYLCGGGCYFSTYINGGVPDPFYCELNKLLVEESARLVYRLRKENKRVYAHLITVAKKVKEDVSYV